MTLYIKCWILLLFALKFALCLNWCNFTCPKPKRHVMCLFKSNKLSSKCNKIKKTMFPKLRTEVLRLHNDFRNKWANGEWPEQKDFPKASNMQLMRWDYELEKLAERNVINCLLRHDECRQVARFAFGQNLAFHWKTKSQPLSAISGFKIWVEEFKLAEAKDILSPFVFREGVSHFPQLVWAKSRLVGCSMANYKDPTYTRNFSYTVCNYGPRGNMGAEMIYKAGRPCSQCPPSTKCTNETYQYLCQGNFPEDKIYENIKILKSKYYTVGQKSYAERTLNNLLVLIGCAIIIFIEKKINSSTI